MKKTIIYSVIAAAVLLGVLYFGKKKNKTTTVLDANQLRIIQYLQNRQSGDPYLYDWAVANGLFPQYLAWAQQWGADNNVPAWYITVSQTNS
jgi:hypothetical protein